MAQPPRGVFGARPPSATAYFVALGGVTLLLLALCLYCIYFCCSKVKELSAEEQLQPQQPLPKTKTTPYPVQPGVREGAQAMARICRQLPTKYDVDVSSPSTHDTSVASHVTAHDGSVASHTNNDVGVESETKNDVGVESQANNVSLNAKNDVCVSLYIDNDVCVSADANNDEGVCIYANYDVDVSLHANPTPQWSKSVDDNATSKEVPNDIVTSNDLGLNAPQSSLKKAAVDLNNIACSKIASKNSTNDLNDVHISTMSAREMFFHQR